MSKGKTAIYIVGMALVSLMVVVGVVAIRKILM